MITKGIVKSINRTGNRCVVELPLFQNASDTSPVELEALISISPGMFNNLFVSDIVFVAFEENALEKPVVIGKLFKGTAFENKTSGGAAITDTLRVNSSATLPSTTKFEFPAIIQHEYKDLNTPKNIADYVKWLEAHESSLFSLLEDNFICFKNWAQWQLMPENLEIDDGDLDINTPTTHPERKDGAKCTICGDKCIKNKIRSYLKLDLTKTYPNK